MPDAPLSVRRRVRLFAGIAFVLSFGLAILVRVGLNDGGWPLLIVPAGAAAVILWPTRSILAIAILLNALMMILAMFSIGLFYGFSLAALIFALAALRGGADRAVA